MLNKSENKIMSVIAKECNENSALLISPDDLKSLACEKELTNAKIDKIVNDLYTDGYYDLVLSNRQGQSVYCITLTEKGKGYLRNKKLMRRNLIYRVMLSAVLALFSFIIGLILKAIF